MVPAGKAARYALAPVGDTIGDIGEFGLIGRLLDGAPLHDGVLLGPGDDAAVLARPHGAVLAAADLLIEGRHFDRAFSPPGDIGYKALAVNVSDIAAMGGHARYALISVGIPATEEVRAAEALYAGLTEAAHSFGVAIVGGDTVRSDTLVVSVAVIGEVGHDGVVRRDGAQPGDLLCVTGALGGAAAGLALLRAGTDRQARQLGQAFPELERAHRRGRARATEGPAAAAAGARAMIDVSDGLAADVGHICTASRVAVRIDGAAVPVADGVRDVERWLGGPTRPPGEVSVLALTGGDDYELAIAIPGEMVDALAASIAPTPLTVVGEFLAGDGVEVTGLPEAAFAAVGWDHFRT